MQLCIPEVAVRRSRSPSEFDELVVTQRVAKVTAALCHGEGLTVRQVADMTGTSYRNASSMLNIISTVVAIYDDHGTWQLCVFREATE